ncbi:acyl carrier protein [Streptomyces sp. SP18CS02]|uniref:acyl carrier protein n=1 Tax=Streptomyces sp. SP18CS02 TaxID=3002531 RepID=UPI002E79A078|nr:acyl carrier protein [Streptomyces sp. SP18CS02]MEE1753795.1 acyl carrier protein [Streptomyces sp. SP18CS02]
MAQPTEQQNAPRPDATAVLDEIRAQTGKELGLDIEQVTPDTVLKQLPGADSVRLLRVVAQVERIYDVEFDDEDVFRVRTPKELADLVTAQLAEGA